MSRDGMRLGGGAGTGIDLKRGVARSAKSSKFCGIPCVRFVHCGSRSMVSTFLFPQSTIMYPTM